MSLTRKTKIVATVGPSSSSRECLEKLVKAGVNVFRINCSHAQHDIITVAIKDIREIAKAEDRSVGILLDLSGPKIRTRSLVDGNPVELEDGQEFTLTSRDILGTNKEVSTNFKNLSQEVKAGDCILLDDGLIELSVLSCSQTDVLCKVVNGGILKERKGINIPGIRLSIPSVTEKDKVDLAFGLKNEVDFVALSFVRDPDDIKQLRSLIGEHWPPVSVIAKIEKPEALEHIDAILEEADGIMIARGDLGVELPPEKVPPAQKKLTQSANAKGKPVITATQMLESMIVNPRPTRAEASDVANAIFDGTDAVMLSGETASGDYPVEAVEMMARIAVSAEESLDPSKLLEHETASPARAIAHAACSMAYDMKARVIAAFTKTGSTAKLISQLRPAVPIVALTQQTHVYRQLSLVWGTEPLMLTEVSDSESTLAMVEDTLMDRGIADPEDCIIITGGLPIAARGQANFVKLSVLPPHMTPKYFEFKGI
jgi:pyruvate kinase